MIRIKRHPYHITEENPGLEITLKFKYNTYDSIIALLTFKNHTGDSIALYKPLIGFEGTEELIIHIIEKNRAYDIPYKGKHQEEYEGGTPGALIFIFPKEGKENFLILDKEDVYTSEINIARYYDFKGLKGNFIGQYMAMLPYVSTTSFKHLTKEYPADKKIKPVYFGVHTSDNPGFEVK